MAVHRPGARSVTRPHCKVPDACKAAKPTTHCRSCTAIRLREDPEIAERRKNALKKVLSDPINKQRRIERLRAVMQERHQDPEFMEMRREQGRRLQQELRQRPDLRARSLTPEARAKAAKASVAKKLAWCPIEYRDAYMKLLRSGRVPAAQARQMILDLIEADQRRYFATGRLPQTGRAA